MTFHITIEMKNAPIGPKIRSFLAKYLGDKSRPFSIGSIALGRSCFDFDIIVNWHSKVFKLKVCF